MNVPVYSAADKEKMLARVAQAVANCPEEHKHAAAAVEQVVRMLLDIGKDTDAARVSILCMAFSSRIKLMYFDDLAMLFAKACPVLRAVEKFDREFPLKPPTSPGDSEI